MSQPFQPLELLRRKPIPKEQRGVVINLNRPDEEIEDKQKNVIKDKRKYSTIERAVILDRLKEKKAFAVNIEKISEKTKPSYDESLTIPIPIGEPKIQIITKIDEIIITKPEEKGTMEKGTMEKEQVEPEQLGDELTELNEILKKNEEKEEEPMKEKEEEPMKEEIIIDKPKRGRKPKAQKIEPTRELINVDLSTSEINDQLISEMIPKPSEKIIIKAPTYYMNNRKLYVQKLNELFQPYRKEIIVDEVVSCDKRTESAQFKLLTHQKIVRDYLNLYTPYRGLLLYHALGSGKSCTSIAIAEGMKSDKRIFILTPASLKMNYFSELKNCGDHLYKKNQYWEFVSIDGKPDYVGILSKALSLKTEYIRNNGGAWLVNITKEANYTDKSSEEQKEIDEQLNEMIRSKYVDINYNGLTKKSFQKLLTDLGSNPFDNSVVVIDEAHNFVSRIVNKIKQKKTISYTLYDLLMNASNARVVLLSGTPIINYPNEIGILYNILRGYIKTWTIPINVKSNEKMNTETILSMFDKANFKTHDYVEYSGNKLTITRNPFGFINMNKRGKIVTKGEKNEGEKNGGEKNGAANKSKKITKSGKRKTKKNVYDRVVDKIIYDEQEINEDESADKAYRIGYNLENEPHMGGKAIGDSKAAGGGKTFDKYNGVKLDETGNISDNDFQNIILSILQKNGLEIQKNSTEVKKYKALPDDSKEFLEMFVESESGNVKNVDVFKRRILGLTSYFRSAQEQLLPRFEKTSAGDIFHIEKCEMTPHQFGAYEKIRKVEAEQEKKSKKSQKKANSGAVDEELLKMSSTYRIFSRAACNFTFPAGIQRPMPGEDNKEVDENIFNGLTIKEVKDKEEVEDDEKEDNENMNYQQRISNVLKELSYNEENPREKEYLTMNELGMYSPKFVKVLENIKSEQNQGLHLLYSQFRTIEGIGILKLILEANGYAEFKIHKNSNDNWDIVEDVKDAGKPKFVLYTGTETTEVKEIMRNIYNSTWDFVPSAIAEKLREKHENNYMGEIVKIFMITSSGAEGINLKNTRFVHIVEPYWHMVRIEQVIGRARRICSHKDLPEELRTVKVYLYLSTLSEQQKTSKDNVELRIRDVSRLDGQTPITTDESLFEIASIKDKLNRQILKAVKESAIDCSLYSGKNKDEQLVCYGYGKIESNQFGSFPSLQQDVSEKSDLNIRKVTFDARKITYQGNDYALNEKTNEIFDMESYLRSKDSGSELQLVGRLIRDAKDMRIELI